VQTRNLTIGDVTLPATITAAADFDLKSTIWTFAGGDDAAAARDPAMRE
jgi:hypothetical protein